MVHTNKIQLRILAALFIPLLALADDPPSKELAETEVGRSVVEKTGIAELPDSLQIAADKVEIIELINRYAFTIDNRDLRSFYALFTEDALWALAVPTREEPIEYLQSRAAIEKGFNAVFTRPEVRQRPAGVSSFHVQSGTVFLELKPEYAKTVTQAVIYLQQFNDDGSPMDGTTWHAHNTAKVGFVGVYHDVLVKQGGRWLFKERIFHASNTSGLKEFSKTSGHNAAIKTIGLCVTDLARSREFYSRVFGFEPEPDVITVGHRADRLLGLKNVDMTVHLLQKQGIKLELMVYRNPPAVGGGKRVLNSLGLTHLGFDVSNMEMTLAAITDLGGKVVETSRIEHEGKTTNIRVTDPDGNQIALYAQQ